MKLYNTLSKQIDEIVPSEANKVRIYSCGPTVYDHIHIGNLSSFIYADILRRTLKVSGLETVHAMNFTDVDDKTIRRSQEKYPDLEPKDALLKLTEEYSTVFLEDMKAVGNKVEDISFIKATDSIDDMQQLIRELLDNNFAYHSDDGIYFSISTYQKSGKKYGQLTDITVNSTSQARIQNDEYDKESAHDFALWKKQKGNEPAWDFDIDGTNLKGRPGWHIECSAMSKAILGQPFDIHTGGVDLIFPHHENEIAQSTAAEDNPTYATSFFHNEHLLIDGKKMSKSLNNFYTLETLKDKGFDPLAFRLLVLQAHYNHQAHFSWDNLQAAANRLTNYRGFAALRWQAKDLPEQSSESYTFIANEIVGHAVNGLSIPQALATLSTFSDQLADKLVSQANSQDFENFLIVIDDLLGLDLMAVKDITSEQKQLLEAREQARGAKDWAKSDEIRDHLVSQGISLRDTEHGSIWFPL